RVAGSADSEQRMKLVNLAATVLLNPAARARYDELRGDAKSGRLRSPHAAPTHARPSGTRRTPDGRSSSYRWRARNVRFSTGTPPPVSPLADPFFRRLCWGALLVTLAIVGISERTRPRDRAAPRTNANAGIVYAPDYPPYPVRYAMRATSP